MLKKKPISEKRSVRTTFHFLFYFKWRILLNGNPLKLSDFCPRTISLGYSLDLKMTHDVPAQRYGPPTITEH